MRLLSYKSVTSGPVSPRDRTIRISRNGTLRPVPAVIRRSAGGKMPGNLITNGLPYSVVNSTSVSPAGVIGYS